MKIHICKKHPCPVEDREFYNILNFGFDTEYTKMPDNEKCHCSGKPYKEFCFVHSDECLLNEHSKKQIIQKKFGKDFGAKLNKVCKHLKKIGYNSLSNLIKL